MIPPMGIPFFARRFVAGLTADEAIASVRPLNEAGIAVSLDILGENVRLPQNAIAAATDYCQLISQIHDAKVTGNISIKLTMLGLDISESLAAEQLMRVLDHAARYQMFVRIDMEGSAYTERSVQMFLTARQRYEHVGIVLQAYLHRTAEDLERVLSAGGRVRLCKGAYKEPTEIAFQDMNDVRANYKKLAATLLKRGNYPAFATHDDELINAVLAAAKDLGRQPATFEMQMLFGLRRATWSQLVSQGYNVRVYVPFGASWYPYFSRRLRERKENVLFVLRNLFRD
jgi:proline dehydrogenase